MSNNIIQDDKIQILIEFSVIKILFLLLEWISECHVRLRIYPSPIEFIFEKKVSSELKTVERTNPFCLSSKKERKREREW